MFERRSSSLILTSIYSRDSIFRSFVSGFKDKTKPIEVVPNGNSRLVVEDLVWVGFRPDGSNLEAVEEGRARCRCNL